MKPNGGDLLTWTDRCVKRMAKPVQTENWLTNTLGKTIKFYRTSIIVLACLYKPVTKLLSHISL